MKWKTSPIGEVVEVNPRLAAADRPDLDKIVSFVPMAAVSEKTLRIETHAERPFSEVSKGYTPFKRGDVLIAKITPCFENGKMALADNLSHDLGFGTTEFHVFRPSEKISGTYLFNLLRAPYVRQAGAMKMKGAAGQRRVPANFFASLQIPLPPLDEQKRIAAILDAADALRAKRRESLAELDRLVQSTFIDMFGDPVTNPKGWEHDSLANMGTLKNGLNYGSNECGYEVKCLGVGDFKNHIKISGLETLSSLNLTELPSNEYFLENGDLVFVRSNGNKQLVGRCLSVYPGDEKLTFSGFCIRYRVENMQIDIDYLAHLFRIPSFKRTMLQNGRGANIQNINQKLLNSLNIPTPPLDLQHRFADIVKSIEQQKARQRRHLDELDTLFASLQQRAFNGELSA